MLHTLNKLVISRYNWNANILHYKRQEKNSNTLNLVPTDRQTVCILRIGLLPCSCIYIIIFCIYILIFLYVLLTSELDPLIVCFKKDFKFIVIVSANSSLLSWFVIVFLQVVALVSSYTLFRKNRVIVFLNKCKAWKVPSTRKESSLFISIH